MDKPERTLVAKWDTCQQLEDDVEHELSESDRIISKFDGCRDPDKQRIADLIPRLVRSFGEEKALQYLRGCKSIWKQIEKVTQDWCAQLSDSSHHYDWLLESLNDALQLALHTDWYCEGRNMGWQHRRGHKLFQASTAAEWLEGFMPRTDCTFSVYKEPDGSFLVCNAHHDAPTGESYTLWPVTNMDIDMPLPFADGDMQVIRDAIRTGVTRFDYAFWALIDRLPTVPAPYDRSYVFSGISHKLPTGDVLWLGWEWRRAPYGGRVVESRYPWLAVYVDDQHVTSTRVDNIDEDSPTANRWEVDSERQHKYQVRLVQQVGVPT